MVELSGATGGLWGMGFAGDTLNTAWYARALCPDRWDVAYQTVLGTDALSDDMVAFMQAAGLSTDSISRHPTRQPGLYMIRLDDGERSFSYWRDQSAARTLADDPATLEMSFRRADAIYFSGITVAILPENGRENLFAALDAARGKGARIMFDTNLRPKLWSSVGAMRDGIAQAAARADLVLPSHDDEAAVFGDSSPEATAARYAALGATEVVVKNGGGPMCACVSGRMITLPPVPRVAPVDTTGAGDSFNGAYIARRLAGAPVEEAMAEAHRVACTVVGHRGALVPFANLRA